MKKYMFCVVLIAFLLYASSAGATELVYKPISSSFGGDSLNGNWLIYQADAQNKFQGPDLYDDDPLKEFEESLSHRILNMLASQIVDDAFGGYGEELQGGHYEFGHYIIDVVPTEGVDISVSILDTATGNITSVTVPYYNIAD